VKIMRVIVGGEIPMNTSTYRVISRRCVNALIQCRERSRFLAGLTAWLGFKHIGVPVVHGARYAGVTKYGAWKSLCLALNAITGFSRVLLRWSIAAGLLFSVLSFVAAGSFIVRKLFYGIPVAGYASLIVSVFFMGGLTLMMLGVVGEYVGLTYTETQGRPLYVVRETDEGLDTHTDEQEDCDSSAGLSPVAGVL